MIPPRRPDWQPCLFAYLADVTRRPLAPGRHDCALFAAGAVEAMTGVDPAAAWRGRYTSFNAGLKALKKAGFRDHIALVASHFPEVAPAFAQVGDLGVIRLLGELPALGIFTGEHLAVLRDSGLGFVPREMAPEAWRVP
jgi:hypothetical protein